ncbi:unnamed protein product, partial [Rotaria sordida]
MQGAWIITGGMNTGIMKLVGEIVQTNPNRYRPIHLIGIATWGCVAGSDQLDVHGINVHYAKPHVEERGEAPLEPNHTEFIFVDDGSVRKFGGEITFRASLERAISEDFFAIRPPSASSTPSPQLMSTPSIRSEKSNPIPVVLLVVEGGPNTVRTVHEAVVENNIPAVLFEGTGRCCDLFAKAVRLYKEYRLKFELCEENPCLDVPTILRRYDELKNRLREDLKEELRAISGAGDRLGAGGGKKMQNLTIAGESKQRKEDSVDYFSLVYECIDTRTNFLNIISLHSRSPVEPDIDLAILQALLNATSGCGLSKTNIQRKREQFQLALEWNRVDIVRNSIMKDDRDWENIELNDLFELALNRSQTEFVKLFLDHDFSLTDLFRNNNKLALLYKNSMKEHHVIFSSYNNPLRTIYQVLIQPLIGDFFEVDVALRSQGTSSETRLSVDKDSELCSCCTVPWQHRNRDARPSKNVFKNS